MQPDKLIRSKRKTIALQINENAELIVRAPQHLSERKINQFIADKEDWIIRTKKRVEKHKKHIEDNTEFRDGKKVLFHGDEYEIRLNGRLKEITLSEGFMEFPFSKLENAEAYLIKWYKKRAGEVIPERTLLFAQKLNLNVNKVGITSAKKRWGSCNSKGNINFSYRLIMAPQAIIDYVIVHELMHLKEMNHSTKFWNHVAQLIPDYKNRRKWLRDNQHRIQI